MDDREFVMCVSSLVLGISPDELFDEDNNMVAPYTYEEVLGRLCTDLFRGVEVTQEEVDTLLTTKKTGGMYGGLRLVSADWQPEEDDDEV
jgi:hypothetical protein